MPALRYGLLKPSHGGIGGGVGQSQDGGAGHVTIFVEVDDPAGYLARAEQLGGRTVVPPMEIPNYNLTLCLLHRPTGHLIGRPLFRRSQQGRVPCLRLLSETRTPCPRASTGFTACPLAGRTSARTKAGIRASWPERTT